MIDPPLMQLIVETAKHLPAPTLRMLSAALTGLTADEMSWKLDSITVGVGGASSRDRVGRLIRAWGNARHSPSLLAQHIDVAVSVLEAERASQQISLIWTGPHLPGSTLRRTEQGLLQVIEAAQQELWIVTFAAYRVAPVVAALAAALQRGVRLLLVAESADASDGRLTFDAAAALGSAVRERAEVLVWPRPLRPVDGAGRTGNLHAKCALADDRIAFVSSANLTEYALHLNIELGVLVEEGPLPIALGKHFRNLLRLGHWQPAVQHA